MSCCRSLGALGALAIVIVASGCATANRNTAFRSFTTTNSAGYSTAVDAKQRFLISSVRYARDKEGKATGGPIEVLCAEPSPDALSAFAASLDTSLGLSRGANQTNLSLSEATSEAAGSIGLRTQTITILRDGLYRLCEGYANGALDEEEFRRLARRNQANQLGLLAIEQITGAVRAPALALGGSSATDPAKALESATASLDARQIALEQSDERRAVAKAAHEEAVKKAADAKKDFDALEASLKAAQSTTPQVPVTIADLTTKRDNQLKIHAEAVITVGKREAAVARAEADLKRRARSVEAAQATLDAVQRRASITTSASATIEPMQNGGLSNEAVASLAEAASDIVTTIATTSYINETCLDLMTVRIDSVENEETKLRRGVNLELCRTFLVNAAAQKEAIDNNKIFNSNKPTAGADKTADVKHPPAPAGIPPQAGNPPAPSPGSAPGTTPSVQAGTTAQGRALSDQTRRAVDAATDAYRLRRNLPRLPLE